MAGVEPALLSELNFESSASVALNVPDDGLAACLAEWQRRRDLIVSSLADYRIIPAAGGWSMLLDVSELGFDSVAASQRLLEHGRIAATYMKDWGRENSDPYVRLVCSNEPVQRLEDIASPFHLAFGR